MGVVLLVLLAWAVLPVAPRRPLTWRLGHVDERFGWTRDEVRAAVLAAESVWEHGMGQDLLQEAPDGQVVVELRYDERQRRFERIRREAARLEREGRVLEGLVQGTARQEEQLAGAIQAHNAEVESWSGQRRVPPQTRALLEDQGAALERQAADLAQARARARERQALLWMETRALSQESASEGWTAGAWHGDTHLVVIYTFVTAEELTWELAHELGHALGIEDHVESPDALMAELAPGSLPPWPALRPADREALEAVPHRPRAVRWWTLARRWWSTLDTEEAGEPQVSGRGGPSGPQSA